MGDDSQTFELSQMPYRIVFKDISGYYESCHYCGQSKCSGCTVPFTDAMTIQEVLSKINLLANETFFSDDRQTRGKEM